jgi:hypothetical protein
MTNTEVEEGTPQPLQISAVLGTFLQQMPIPIDIASHASCFQLVPFTEDDGKKSFAVALGFTMGNGLEIFWFRESELRAFIGNAMNAHQSMLKELNTMNPLIVASQDQMQQAIQQKNMVDGKLILGGR